MSCPLQKLHQAFSIVLQNHAYMGLTKDDPAKLESTKEKTIRLAEVFKIARNQIEEAIKEKATLKENEITHLKNLEHDGTLIYKRYTESTNGFGRLFMKCLARYTPELLKKILPSCFSNGMEQAEANTLKEYEEYLAFLKKQMQSSDKDSGIVEKKTVDKKGSPSLKSKEEDEVFDPDQDDLLSEDETGNDSEKKDGANPEKKTPPKSSIPTKVSEKRLKALDKKATPNFDNDDEDQLLQQILAESYSEQFTPADTKKNKGDLFTEEETITPKVKTSPVKLFQFSSIPESKYKTELEKIDRLSKALDRCLKQLNEFNEHPLTVTKFRNVLKQLYLITAALIQLDPDGTKALENFFLNEDTLASIKKMNLISLMTGNNEKITELLSSTPWKTSFEEALEQDGKQIFFGVQKLAGTYTLQLNNGKGARFKESEFQKFRGQVKVTIADMSSLREMKELTAFLEKHLTCCPNSLVITLKEDQELNAECIQLLLKLTRIAEIQINGVKEINFKALGLSESEEHTFIQNLEHFSFPQLDNIILSDHQKNDWTAADYSIILSLCSSFELFKACYQQCSTFQEITLPPHIQEMNAFNAEGFDMDRVTHLLTQFSNLTHIDFSNSDMNDAQLFDLLDQPHLLKLKSLNLNGCKTLTTDALFTLQQLPNLGVLSLPELNQGEITLDLLPKFENPFQIKLFYLASKETRKLVNQLYTGPQNWSAIFQIPLARLGKEQIFPSNQKRLDPKNVAYWLHNKDYTHLKSEKEIVTVLADFNVEINDDNIVDFMGKFPNVKTLSLYDCPNITEKGIIALLKTHPKVETIDLTNCSRITEALLLEEGNGDLLKKMKQIIVTGTAISSELVNIFTEQGVKLKFDNTILKITDADLTTDQALEELLKEKDLTQYKTIDLSDCLTLSNDMLGQLLDHLNAPIYIQTAEGLLVPNPQRLNAAVINIKGCENITDDAFSIKSEKKDLSEESQSKIDLKFLESLDRMVIGQTKITSLIHDLYPNVTFQEEDQPITIQIDPKLQLKECALYHSLKSKKVLMDSEKEVLKALGKRYLHNRIALELFYNESPDMLEAVQNPIDIHSEDFSDISLYFMTQEPSVGAEITPTVFHAHRDILYSQSRYFINGLRPGGEMNKNKNLDILNAHATPKAATAIMELFYGKLSIKDLDSKTAADVAELIGPKNFKFAPLHYQQLLTHIRAQFTLKNADELLTVAKTLEDNTGREEYEGTLMVFLESLDMKDQENFLKISNLAKAHGLKELKKKVEAIEIIKTKDIINKTLEEQHADDEFLSTLALEETSDSENEGFNPWQMLGLGGKKKKGKK